MKTITIYLIAALFFLGAAFIVFRIIAKRDYLQEGRLSLISLILETLIFFLWGGFPYIYGPVDWPAVHLHPTLETMGWIILVGGLVILFTGMAQIGPMRFLGQEATRLKQTGLYRLSRNPQIVGCALYGIGFALLWPSWYALGWVCLFVWVAHMMVLTEEEHLRKAFGEVYVRYCGRTPRYIGRPKA
jgi:protein-S-isoprenylcysteine O-methyltransferase Ste14